MALRVGIDLASVAAVEEQLRSQPQRYLARVFTDAEVRQWRADENPDPARLAGRFAAKEAVRKLLREPDAAIPWSAIEVLEERRGHRARLAGVAADAARRAGLRDIRVSVDRMPGFCAAVALCRDGS
jgi:phosphopantetheine--protein transferase-like protein